MLKAYSGKKTVFIDSLAASMASVIAMAGDTIFMPSNGLMMIQMEVSLLGNGAAAARSVGGGRIPGTRAERRGTARAAVRRLHRRRSEPGLGTDSYSLAGSTLLQG